MRDWVETIIGQVLKRQPTMKPAAPAEKPLVSLKGSYVQKPVDIKDKALWDVCCQFESMFLQQMMSAMRKTVPESKFLPRGYADSVYDGMMDQAIAESGSKQAPLGLAVSMYRQLERSGQTAGGSTPTIQEVRQAADTLKNASPIEQPNTGGL